MRPTLILLMGVLLGLPVSAAEWIKSCKESAAGVLAVSTTTGVNAVNSLQPNQFACAETITATDDAEILYIGDCSEVHVFQFDDPAGDDDESTVVGTPQLCPTNQHNAAANDLACDTVPGGAALVANDANYDVVGVWFRVLAAGSTDTVPVRWMAVCSDSARP